MSLFEEKQQKVPLLQVEDFALAFRVYKKGLREEHMQVIRKLNMTIHKGEVVAVVGASGSGKSLLADAVLGILPENAVCQGRLYYKGELLTSDRQRQLRGREISLIPQSINALDPLMKIGKQVQRAVKQGISKKSQRAIFDQFYLSKEIDNYYPFELSGGMARRVLAATALINNPDLIIADEPTPGLDAQSLQEVIQYIRQVADKGKGVMLITHDITAALKIADKFVIMNQGETIETVKGTAFIGEGTALKKSYTKALWHALPQNKFSVKTTLTSPIIKEKSDSNKQSNLQVKQVSYQLDHGQLLFKNVNLTLHPGEVVGLKGDSGIGKTTLAKIIAGYLKPTNGIVTINNELVNQQQHPVQLVWQHPEQSINPKWTMKQVLKESNMLDEETIKMLGIRKEWLSRWPSELSGGELQRFAIARVLNEQTKYLLLDEITTMLDAITQAEIWHQLLNIVAIRKIGVLAISHDEDLLTRVCHRILDFNEMRY